MARIAQKSLLEGRLQEGALFFDTARVLNLPLQGYLEIDAKTAFLDFVDDWTRDHRHDVIPQHARPADNWFRDKKDKENYQTYFDNAKNQQLWALLTKQGVTRDDIDRWKKLERSAQNAIRRGRPNTSEVMNAIRAGDYTELDVIDRLIASHGLAVLYIAQGSVNVYSRSKQPKLNDLQRARATDLFGIEPKTQLMWSSRIGGTPLPLTARVALYGDYDYSLDKQADGHRQPDEEDDEAQAEFEREMAQKNAELATYARQVNSQTAQTPSGPPTPVTARPKPDAYPLNFQPGHPGRNKIVPGAKIRGVP